METLNFFDNIKYVLFDFDDTLCIHSSHKPWTRANDHKQEVYMLKNQYFYPTSRANAHMREFINICKKNSIKMGLISHVNSVPQSIAKINWCEKQYDVKFENFCVGTREQKVEMLKRISDSTNIDKDEIIIIDDSYLTLTEAESEGFMTATPMEIVNFIQDIKGFKPVVPRKTFRINRTVHYKDTYDPNFGDNRICVCGHTYARHFDPYEDNAPIGCKYCGCRHFVEERTPDPEHSSLET